MVLSKRILCRYIIIFCILNPSIFLAFAPAVNMIRQAIQTLVQRPETVRFLRNSADATFALISNPPKPPPHIQAQLKEAAKKAIQNAKAAAAKPSAPFKPFPGLAAMAATLPASVKSPAIAQLPAAATFLPPQTFFAAAKEKIAAAAISPVKIPTAAMVQSTTTQAIKSIAKAPAIQLCVTPSAPKSSIVMMPSHGIPQSAAVPLKQTISAIPSQFAKNTTVAAVAQHVAQTPKTIIPPCPSLPIQQPVPTLHIAKPDAIISDLQAINNNYAANLAYENHRIATNPQLLSLFTAQKITVPQRLKEACNLSTSPEIIKAQLTLLNNSYVHQVENFHLNYAIKKMVAELTDRNGEFIGCLSQKTADRLSHFASMKVNVGDFFVNCWTGLKKAVGFNPDVSQKFVENSYNTNLYNFCENMLQKKIDESQHFLDLIRPDHPLDWCPKCKIHWDMDSAFYLLTHNEHHIPKAFEQDPIWPGLKKILDQLSVLDGLDRRVSAHSQLESRHNIVQFLLQKLNRQNGQPAPAFLYDIASKYQNPLATVEYLAKLSSDHPEASIREAHSLIFGTQTLPKIYDHPHLEPFKDVLTVSKDLFLEKFKDLRATYLRLTALKPENEHGATGMRQGFVYTKKALESETHRAIYKNLASEMLRALTDVKTDQTVFSWPDFSKTFTDPVATQIQHRILPLLNHALADRHLSSESPDLMVQMQRAHAAGAIDHIGKIYQALSNNNIPAALEIEKTILPHFTRNFFEEEIKKLNAKPGLTTDQIIESVVMARMILNNAQTATASQSSSTPVSQHTSEMPLVKGSDLRKTDSQAPNAHQETHYAHENNAEHQTVKQHHGKTGGSLNPSIDPEDPEKDEDSQLPAKNKLSDQEKIEEGVKYVIRNKIQHIFKKAEHNLDPLVSKLKGHENTVRTILEKAKNKLPNDGIFTDIPVDVEGFTVYVRGRVLNGVPKIGTMFVK